jgi:cytosine/adenosine deaminase-related metal-dependent hydrolase
VTTLIRGACVLTLDEADTEFAQADILVADGLIQSIGGALDAGGADIIEAVGMLAMPGLVNGHFHSQQNLMAGSVRSLPLELFMLHEVPPPGIPGPSPELVRLQTLLGAVEMLRGGTTAVHDDAFHNPGPTRPGIDAMMQAYADSGLRATVTINHPNVVEHAKYPFLADLLPAEIRAEMDAAPLAGSDELMDLYAWFHHRWHGAATGRLRIGVANSAPQRVTPDHFRRLSSFGREHDLPFTVHVLETRLQRVFGQEVWGESLVQHMHRLGLLDRRMLVVHAIWVDEADMALLAASGCTVAHNPVCNLRLGSGIMPFRRLADNGIPIGLGTDERSADDRVDMWAVMKTAGLVHQVTDPDWTTWPQPGEILRAATAGAARGMGRAGQGWLRAGADADLILVDLDALPFTPLNDLRRQLVYSGGTDCVALTMVAGRVVAERGRVLTVDERGLRRAIRTCQPEIDRIVRATASGAARLMPYYDAMYRRSLEVDIGFTRWGSAAP